MSLATQVKELRQRTGAGMMDCKKALEATASNMDEAIKWLRENGIAKAAKKGDRVAAEGLTKTLIKGNKALIIELNAETDFVAKNKEFLDLLDKVANAIIDSDAKTLDEALKVNVNGETIEEVITNGTATIGEKITLRRFQILEKNDSETFYQYSHMGGKISVIAKFAKDDQELEKNIAMHIAAEKPVYLSQEEVSQEVIDNERDIIYKESVVETLKKEEEKVIKKEEEDAGKKLYSKEEFAERMEQAAQKQLPEQFSKRIDGMVEGRIKKFLKQVALLDQPFIMDDKKTVSQVLTDADNKVLEFVRYEVGEGIEKEEINFADEVAAQANL